VNYDLRQLHHLLASGPQYPGGFSGRGVVISAGGRLLPGAYLAVRSLRHAGCLLPIEIWYLGERELPSPRVRDLFGRQGVSFVDSLQVAHRHGARVDGGWQNKPFMILRSRFKEVLLLDADNMVLQNPERLFGDYKATGAMLWPDFTMAPGSLYKIKPGAWKLLGLEPRNDAEVESGQLLFDKERCWQALVVALHMNENSNYFYRLCYGDKDTFTLAFALTHTPCTVVSRRPMRGDRGVRIHFASDGSELFQHCRKWQQPVASNPSLPSYRLETQCFEWLREFEAANQA
jgi:Mannosyltransferase putative